jgi:hypothetical protein
LLALVFVLLGLQDAEHVVFVSGDFGKIQVEALVQCEVGVEGPIQKDAVCRHHGFLEESELAVVSVFGGMVVADSGALAQVLLAKQGPDEKPNGGMIRPFTGS